MFYFVDVHAGVRNRERIPCLLYPVSLMTIPCEIVALEHKQDFNMNVIRIRAILSPEGSLCALMYFLSHTHIPPHLSPSFLTLATTTPFSISVILAFKECCGNGIIDLNIFLSLSSFTNSFESYPYCSTFQ